MSGLSGLPGWGEALLGVVVALLVVWAVAIMVLVRVAPGRLDLAQAARLLPDLLRLVTGLARDRGLPRGVRVRLWLLLAYLASPVDLVPDVVPVVGYADDAVLVVLTLRSVVRAAGTEALARHWPGGADGLAVVHRLAGLHQDGSGRLSTP